MQEKGESAAMASVLNVSEPLSWGLPEKPGSLGNDRHGVESVAGHSMRKRRKINAIGS
jgi:hypothetical protein